MTITAGRDIAFNPIPPVIYLEKSFNYFQLVDEEIKSEESVC